MGTGRRFYGLGVNDFEHDDLVFRAVDLSHFHGQMVVALSQQEDNKKRRDLEAEFALLLDNLPAH